MRRNSGVAPQYLDFAVETQVNRRCRADRHATRLLFI
jgi:hypothetical protein